MIIYFENIKLFCLSFTWCFMPIYLAHSVLCEMCLLGNRRHHRWQHWCSDGQPLTHSAKEKRRLQKIEGTKQLIKERKALLKIVKARQQERKQRIVVCVLRCWTWKYIRDINWPLEKILVTFEVPHQQHQPISYRRVTFRDMYHIDCFNMSYLTEQIRIRHDGSFW